MQFAPSLKKRFCSEPFDVLYFYFTFAFLLGACGKSLHMLDYQLGYREEGLASWYGKDFHGRPTASGEIYNMFGLSAAHQSFPLGTLLLVSDIKTGRKVKVKVNDRGPFIGNRILDLSYGAAKRLGIVEVGVAKVQLEIIGRAPIIRPKAKGKQKTDESFLVQIGSYQNRENALRMKTIVAQYRKNTFIEVYETKKGRVYRVRVGPFSSQEAANSVADRLRSQVSRGEKISPIVVDAY